MKDKNINNRQQLLEIIFGKDSWAMYESQDSLIDHNLFPNESVQEMNSGERFSLE